MIDSLLFKKKGRSFEQFMYYFYATAAAPRTPFGCIV